MAASNTAISYPTAATGSLGASIAPTTDATDSQYVFVAESALAGIRGIHGRARGFAPVEGTRILVAPTGPNDFTQTTLRSGLAVSALQLANDLRPGFGSDVSFNVQRSSNGLQGGVVQERELGNVGVILTGEYDACGQPNGQQVDIINSDAKMVGRIWKWNEATQTNEYLQFINGLDQPPVFTPSSQVQAQAYQWVSEANGNFGIMQTFPQHRLHLGPSPCDDGEFGADLGDYVIIGGSKLTIVDGCLYVDGCKLRCSKKDKHHKKCKHDCGCDRKH